MNTTKISEQQTSVWVKANNRDLFNRFNLTYKSSLASSDIKTVNVYRQGDVCYLQLNINRNAYENFIEFIKENNYPRPDFSDKHFNGYKFQIPNIQYLKDFLNVLAAKYPDINEIADTITTELKPHCIERPTIPGWAKNNSFADGHEYRPCLPSKFKYIYTRSMRNGEWLELTIKAKSSSYEEIASALKSLKMEIELHEAISFCQIKVKSLNELRDAFKALSELDGTVSLISDHIIDEYVTKSSAKDSSIFSSANLSEKAQYNINGERIDSPVP